MVTKAWVDGKLAELRQADGRLQEIIGRRIKPGGSAMIIEALGVNSYYAYAPDPQREISLIEKLGAICAYLGIEVVRQAKAETIVAQKAKKA